MYIPTEETICGALYDVLQERSMDHITVKMVCQRAGISRQALYNHYYSLSNVLSDALRRELAEPLHGCATGLDWTDCLRTTLLFFQEKRAAILNVYRSSYRRELMHILEHAMLRGIRQEVKARAREQGLAVTEEDQAFFSNLYLFVILGLLDQFFAAGMTPDPESIVSRCEVLLTGTLRAGLRRLAEKDERNPAGGQADG